jgi:hypothetical protein
MSGSFLCVLTRFTGRMCNIQRDYLVSGSFTLVFLSLPPIDVRLYTGIRFFRAQIIHSKFSSLLHSLPDPTDLIPPKPYPDEPL